MHDPDSKLLPKYSLIGWTVCYLLPLVAFIFLIVSGYIKAPPDQMPFWVRLLAPMRLADFSLVICLAIVWLAKVSPRRKIQWTIFSLAAVFVEVVVLSTLMTFWFMAHIPKT